MNQSEGKRRGRLKWGLGAVVIGAAIVAMVSVQLGNNAVYFYTPDEAYAKAPDLTGKTVRVGGMVTPDTIKWDAENLDLKFMMSDLKGHEIAVHHRGAPPDMFKANQGVVVEGLILTGASTSDPGANTDNNRAQLRMASKKLMVKHSEEYKKPGDHSPDMDKSMLERSIFKSEGSQP